MAVCTVWLVVLYFLSSVQNVNTSVNTSRDLKVTTSQSSDANAATHGSNKVVDGCTTQIHTSGCCSHTSGNPSPNEVWWQINLGDQVVIEHIQIYYRDENTYQRFGGFQIYLSNTSQWRNSDSCYTDKTPTRDMLDLTPLITSCTGNTRYLTVYVDRQNPPYMYKWYSDKAILELCEVEIIGCPVGKYGNGNCDSSCDTTCVGSLCHPTSGRCTYCAAELYKSEIRCIPCTNCLNDVCDVETGVCSDCAAGFYRSGDLCIPCTNCLNDVCDAETGVCAACLIGYHGAQCDQSCFTNCKDSVCNQDTGKCTACLIGYHGAQCDQPCSTTCKDSVCNQDTSECTGCVSGYHGNTCEQPCPINCKDNMCKQDTGFCEGCVSGYHGNTCEQPCPINCKDNMCKQDTGFCEDCEDRFYGPLCVACSTNCADPVCNKTSGKCRQCLAGFHGFTCNQNCSVNCKNNTCHQDNGFCTTGCDSGYHGNTCEQPCPINCKDNMCKQDTGVCEACIPGKYGDTCGSNCTSNCKNNTCYQTSGQCIECVAGFFTNGCNQSCPINCKDVLCGRNSGECSACNGSFHGSNCNRSCSSFCTGDICVQGSGHCIGCKDGYYGLKCNETCGQCIGVSCDMTEGTCECSEGWEGQTCLTRKAMVSASEDQTATYAGGAVGAVVVIAIVAIATFVILRRRRLLSEKANHRSKSFENSNTSRANLKRQNTYEKPREQKKGAVTTSEDGRVYVNMHDIDLNVEDDAVYTNSPGSDTDVADVSIHDIRSIIDSKMVDKAVAFKEEFKTFPWGAVHPHEFGKKASNKAKNRFKTTFPYDHSRIILETIGHDIDTSYTNANYLDSVEATKMYIASQGPKPNTLDDFWRMVWQASSGKIVMLTNTMEGGVVKCHKYWPDEGEPLTTDTFQLKLDNERTYAFYAIRDISIVKTKTKEERLVHQFHFTTWPDHGTPDTQELVLFHRRVTSYETQLTGQMVVHCSAGLGRTGTFIGLDALLSYGKKTGKVDIPSYVRTMRKDRMNMIQNYEQYIALHELLVEGFNLQDSQIFRMNFPAVLATMCPKNKPANQTKIHEEFKALQTFNPSYTPSSCKAALLKENKDKNRNMEILAVDKFRAFLQSQPPNRTDYINAILIQSHTSRSGYLVTQFPLEDTVDDFWTMVRDYSCENIVVLGQPPEECWLGKNGSTTSAAFSFKAVDERFTSQDLTIIDYEVTGESSSSEATVRLFTMKQWTSETLLPTSDSSLLLLLEQLDSRRKSNNTKPVVVMCRDGCTQSGLFCCISNIRDQMKMDDEVDIFQTARQLKKRRPEALEDVKQYQYCYNILGQYLDSTDIYIN